MFCWLNCFLFLVFFFCVPLKYFVFRATCSYKECLCIGRVGRHCTWVMEFLFLLECALSMTQPYYFDRRRYFLFLFGTLGPINKSLMILGDVFRAHDTNVYRRRRQFIEKYLSFLFSLFFFFFSSNLRRWFMNCYKFTLEHTHICALESVVGTDVYLRCTRSNYTPIYS